MIKIGSVVWPGEVGIGAGLVKGTATFLDLGQKADSLEIGSITRTLQEGNSGQTVWKYPQEKSLRHNAGMPNPGAEGIVEQLFEAQYKVKVPWGLNIAVTPGIADAQAAKEDIVACASTILERGLHPAWVTLNISSPDTQDSVEMLSEPQRIQMMLPALREVTAKFKLPLWLKVGPGMKTDRYSSLGELCLNYGVEAVVCGNTLPDPNGEAGGWAGEAARARAAASVWQMKKATQDKLPIVAAGGISEGWQVARMMRLGASGVQVVSALLFRGREAALEIRREYELQCAHEERLTNKLPVS